MMEEAGDHNLKGGVKAALMLLCIGKPMASRLVTRLNRDEVAGLITSAKALSNVSRTEIDAMIDSFSDMYGKGVKFLGTEQEVLELLSDILPEEMSDVMNPPKAVDSGGSEPVDVPVWERIRTVPAAKIAEFLNAEHVQLDAAMLDAMDREQASSVIPLLNRDRRSEVLRRMLVVQPLPPLAKQVLEQVVRQGLLGEDPDAKASVKRKQVAEIINAMKSEDAREVIEELKGKEPEQAMALSKLLFSFEDLAKLDDEAIAMILDTAGTEQLSFALQGAAAALREKLLSTVSARAKRMIESELETGVKADEDKILDSQRKIASVALQLEQEKRIVLPACGEAG